MSRVQRGGHHSTNIQTDNLTINQGLTYAEVREIALDVFRANFVQLSKQATQVARERAEEITDKFLRRLEQQNSVGIQQAQDPSFQYALFTVQKEYAKSGVEELGDLLVDLLVDRTRNESRSLLQIVLDESLSVAPKLTNDQLAALSVIFLFRYARYNKVTNYENLFEFLDRYIHPYTRALSKNVSCYRHLEYTGCGTIGSIELKLTDILKTHYRKIFSKDFSVEDAVRAGFKDLMDSNIFISSIHREERFQINAMTDDDLREKGRSLNLNDSDVNNLIRFSKDHLMSDVDIKQLIITNREYMESVFDVWENSNMKNLTITSVGLALGHANVKKNDVNMTDLSVWIN